MFVLPMGLGTSLRRMPLVTLLICGIWLWVWATDKSSDQISWQIFKAAADSGVRDRARDLFVEYCVANRGDRSSCRRYAVLVWNGFPGKHYSPDGTKRRKKITGNDDPPVSVIDIDVRDLLRERELADLARNELKDCGTSRRCFRYKEILFNFLARHRHDADDFAEFRSYQAFGRATRSYQQTLGRICKQFDCLIPSHVTYVSVAWAQFRHGGFAHMFWNLALFLVFGSYVEQRLVRPIYLIVLMTGGMAGLAVQASFFSSRYALALGGSAIVSVALGMFYVFFLHHRMTFWVWLPRRIYLGSRFKAPVLWCIPLLYVLSDLAGTLSSGFADLLANRVAHSAHLTGLGCGLLFAWLWKRLDPMPPTYIYRGEIADIQRLAATREIARVITWGERFAKTNPENIDAMEIGVNKILAWASAGTSGVEASLALRGRSYLIANLQTVLAVRTRQGQLPRLVALLSNVSFEMPYVTFLNQLGQTHILRLGDAALALGQPIITLRMYDVFLRRFPGTRKAITVDRSASIVIETLSFDERTRREIASFIHTHQDSTLLPRLRAWLAKASAA